MSSIAAGEYVPLACKCGPRCCGTWPFDAGSIEGVLVDDEVLLLTEITWAVGSSGVSTESYPAGSPNGRGRAAGVARPSNASALSENSAAPKKRPKLQQESGLCAHRSDPADGGRQCVEIFCMLDPVAMANDVYVAFPPVPLRTADDCLLSA